MAGYDEARHGELARINALVEAYERAHEREHRDAGMPLQLAFCYASDPSGRGDDTGRRFIFGREQVVGINNALALIRQIATGYGIDIN